MQHQDLVQGRWLAMTLAEQLGNVGSEYERVMKAKAAGNKPRAESAFIRFLELMDLTLADGRWKGARRREMARLREQSIEELEKIDYNPSAGLSRYYMNFAISVRGKL